MNARVIFFRLPKSIFEFVCALLFAAFLIAPHAARGADDYFQEVPVARKALVIGVNDYAELDDLSTPSKDADAIQSSLVQHGFTVSRAGNASLDGLFDEIDAFTSSLDEGDIAVIYYSGHGFQYEGSNYLVPSSSPKCPSVTERVFANIPLTFVRDEVLKKRVGMLVVILDACRTSPFRCTAPAPVPGGQLRLTASPAPGAEPEGLAPAHALPPDLENLQTALVFAMAASPGKPAWTGGGPRETSVYTGFIKKWFGFETHTLSDMFRKVRIDVMQLTANNQRPWEETSDFGNFVVNPDARILQGHRDLWGATLTEAEAGDYRAVALYLAEYPGSRFTAMARRWLRNREADSPPPMVVAEGGFPRMEERGLRGPATPRASARASSGRRYGGTLENVVQRMTRRVLTLQPPPPLRPAAPARGPESPPPPIAVQSIDGREFAPGTEPAEAGSDLGSVLTRSRSTRNAAPEAKVQVSDDAKVEVNMSRSAEGAESNGHAQLEAFNRALAIRRQLREAGYDPGKIKVVIPRSFVRGEGALSPDVEPDTITIEEPVD